MEKELRRKKTLERNSNRLAFITSGGHLHTIDEQPSSPYNDSSVSSPSSFNRPQSSPLDFSSLSHHDSPPSFRYSQLHDVSRHVEANEDSTMARGKNEVIATTTSDNHDHHQACQKSGGGGGGIFHLTLKEVNSCVILSENTRVFCSIMIALIVVIAYANLPHYIIKSKSIISSRPLYVLLATDVMIVSLRLRVANQICSKDNKEEVLKSSSDQWGEAIRLMEWGLVFYQIFRAVFIDCSFYTVIVVSGFSFI